MPRHHQRCAEVEEDGGAGTKLMVYNTLKTVLNFSAVVRENRERKQGIEKALKLVANKVSRLVREHLEDGKESSEVLAAMAQIKIPLQNTSLPDQLGSVHARQVLETLIGDGLMLNPCEEYVSHARKAASGHSDSRSAVPARKDKPESSSDDDDDDCTGSEKAEPTVSIVGSSLPGPVYLLEFARSPKAFLEAIKEGPELQKCRDALNTYSFDVVLSSGVKVLVAPDIYEAVIAAISDWNLKRRHVVVGAEFEDALMGALADVGAGVVEKDRKVLPPPPMVIKRTFLEIPIDSSLRSAPSGTVVVSTTDANGRVKIKPRKA